MLLVEAIISAGLMSPDHPHRPFVLKRDNWLALGRVVVLIFAVFAASADGAEHVAPPVSRRDISSFELAAIMGGIILAGLGWVWSLRRQVRRQTAAFHQEKKLLATLIDHLPDNVYVKDLHGRYVLTNLAHSRFHGAPSPRHFRGKSGFDLFPRDIAQAYADGDAQVLSGRVQVLQQEEQAFNALGVSRCLASTKVPLRDQDGHIIGLVGFSRDITDAKQAESQLREKQRSLSTLLSNLPGLAYRCRDDQDRTMEFLSEGALELTGYSPSDLVANHRISYDQVIHPEDRQRVHAEIELALQQRQRFQLLYRILTRTGSEKFVWEQGSGIFSEDGRLEALEGFVADVTERRRADEAMRDSEARFRAIWEHSIDGMRLTDGDGRILAVNEAFCHLVKLPRERLIGKPFAVAYRAGDPAGVQEPYLAGFRTGKIAPRTTARVQLWNAEERDLEISSCFVEVAGQGRAVLSILRDVSERRRVESVLAYERDLLGTLFDNLPDALYFKDLKSRFVRVSKSKLESARAMALLRYRFLSAVETSRPGTLPQAQQPQTASAPPAHLASREAFAEFIIGKTDFDFFDEPRARSAFDDEQEIIRTGRPLIGKLEQTNHLDGRVTWSLTTKMPWRDKDGRLIGTFGVSKNITGIKDAEASLEVAHRQLVEASRQAGMAEVATGVLHNVGNVLNSVNVSVNLLAEKIQQSRASGVAKVVALMREHSAQLGDYIMHDPRGRQVPLYLEQLAERLADEQAFLLNEVSCLAENLEHIKNIVALQQTYAKPAGVTESVQAVDLLENALRINSGALHRHRVQVNREYQTHLPEINIDKHKVLQILVNLVSNAGHACAQSVRPDKQLIVRLAQGKQHVKFSISDNGVGIAPENLTRIFSLGFTTRAGGHGFGLHSGALAAREMGGSLLSHSQGLGQGATFILELPISAGRVGVPPVTSSSGL
jgi:PAS domain S-box-containing protein